MVYEKNKSGDPDFDDKVPLEQHGGKLATSPDGREVVIHEATGPVDRYTGEHVSMDSGATAEDLDNRPAPGGQAEKPSEVQTYKPEDTAPGKALRDTEKKAGASQVSSGDSAQTRATKAPGRTAK
jgi:hypothetical protein